ncbi:MAG: endonuclease III domain-containing protein [Thermodesulfobacteriota bacterium]
MDPAPRLRELYRRLLDAFGPQGWWPGETPLEVLVGAVLTQNTNWGNVERAIMNLKAAGVLDFLALRGLPRPELAGLIRPAGYYNLKADRLGNLLDLLYRRFGADWRAVFALPLPEARALLLAAKGVGPETADSILLYAGGLPSFVIDAYTFRALTRHGLGQGLDYHKLRALFMASLPVDSALYNEYHALLVRLGKERCKKGQPLCAGCPAAGW